MMSGTETEDLDVELLVAARSGEIDAIASVCNHYRGRLMILATNAGAERPESVVQMALTAALLEIEPVESPSLADFESTLFERVVVDSDLGGGHGGGQADVLEPSSELIPQPPMPPEPPADPSSESAPHPPMPPEPLAEQVPVEPTAPFLLDDDADGNPVPGLVALVASRAGAGLSPDLDADPGIDPHLAVDTEPVVVDPTLFDPSTTAELIEAEQAAQAPMVAGGPLLSERTGPVDWSVLANEEAPSGPVLMAPSNRVVAGGAALLCGVGLLAAIVLFLGGDDDDAAVDGDPQLAALVPADEDSTDSASGPEPAAPEATEQSRSSGAVSDSTPSPGTSSTVEPTTSTTAASSSTASTTVTTVQPSTTAPPTTPAPTITEAPSTSSTFVGPRPGDFTGEELDDQTFRGNLVDHVFTGATLTDIDFRGADLRGVSFDGATLRNVRFINTDLSGADFSGADMEDTEFNRNTNISGVDFRNSVLDDGEIEAFFRQGQEPIGFPSGDFDFDDD